MHFMVISLQSTHTIILQAGIFDSEVSPPAVPEVAKDFNHFIASKSVTEIYSLSNNITTYP